MTKLILTATTAAEVTTALSALAEEVDQQLKDRK
jgi:hypothetical protein